jgi:hypothetical protein
LLWIETEGAIEWLQEYAQRKQLFKDGVPQWSDDDSVEDEDDVPALIESSDTGESNKRMKMSSTDNDDVQEGKTVEQDESVNDDDVDENESSSEVKDAVMKLDIEMYETLFWTAVEMASIDSKA